MTEWSKSMRSKLQKNVFLVWTLNVNSYKRCCHWNLGKMRLNEVHYFWISYYHRLESVFLWARNFSANSKLKEKNYTTDLDKGEFVVVTKHHLFGLHIVGCISVGINSAHVITGTGAITASSRDENIFQSDAFDDCGIDFDNWKSEKLIIIPHDSNKMFNIMNN